MAVQDFSLGTILTITTGKLLSPDGVGGVYEILNYMTRDNLMTHQLPRASRHCAPYILKEWPVLGSEEAMREVARLDEVITQARAVENMGLGDTVEESVKQWLKTFAATLGLPEKLSISRVPADDYYAKDPIEELSEMVGDKPIIQVDG